MIEMLMSPVAQGVGFLCLMVVALEGLARASVWTWRKVAGR